MSKELAEVLVTSVACVVSYLLGYLMGRMSEAVDRVHRDIQSIVSRKGAQR